MVKLYHPDNGFLFSGDDVEIAAIIARGGKVIKPGKTTKTANIDAEEAEQEHQHDNAAIYKRKVKK